MAAAAESPRKRLQEEAICSVCLDFFADPVTLDCGHNFCQACIGQWWGHAPATHTARDAPCPQCQARVQRRSLQPNRQLANMVEIAKELSLPVKAEGGGWAVCQGHQEPLNLFCKADAAPICVVCERSQAHRAHDVVPLQEAARECEDHICSCLETLRKEREKFLVSRADVEKESQDLLKQMKAEKEKTVEQFQQLYQFLEEQEKLRLVQMTKLEHEIAWKRDEHLAKISKKLSSVERTMQEMEGKRQQSANELLQDMKDNLKKCEENKFEKSVVFSPALKWRIRDQSDINLFLGGFLKQFQDTLISGFQLKKAKVTLDPDTANPRLILSAGQKSARLGEERQILPPNLNRFDSVPFVLGSQGFTAGRHFWDVIVGIEENWSVGVARKSVRRKGEFIPSPQEGIWHIGKWDGEYRASFFSPRFHLSPREDPKRIRVSLNYEAGWVDFHDADTAALIFAYLAGPFSGETLLPFFRVWGKAQLILSP
ncbi:E3 ubiquitin-protein ligase TRIM7-like [Elgaria multicarinata webbii]|uniref:E3 ubiquitin-protein ligase TRIM7-like n=1 Tax=Elgaria multicarinata webbii TaxID=159646 RepID=UPI002FCCD7FD